MKFVVYFFIPFVIFSCTSGIETKAVDLTPFFCDNSSKVWMVNNVNLKNPSLPVAKIDFREVFIFYKSGRIIVQPLNSLGNIDYEKAEFLIDSESRILKIYFSKSKESWTFKIGDIHANNVILKPISNKIFHKNIEIVPLPEF